MDGWDDKFEDDGGYRDNSAESLERVEEARGRRTQTSRKKEAIAPEVRYAEGWRTDPMSDNSIKRFTRLLLYSAQGDHATELIVAPSAGTGAPIKYRVGDTWYDLAPPPSHILR